MISCTQTDIRLALMVALEAYEFLAFLLVIMLSSVLALTFHHGCLIVSFCLVCIETNTNLFILVNFVNFTRMKSLDDIKYCKILP